MYITCPQRKFLCNSPFYLFLLKHDIEVNPSEKSNLTAPIEKIIQALCHAAPTFFVIQ